MQAGAGALPPRTDPSLKPKPLLTRPSLSHIPSSDPNPPTYPKPEPVLAAKAKLSAATGGTANTGSTAGTVPGKKKKKMSGLAKLLAERKEREDGEKLGAGRWGLG